MKKNKNIFKYYLLITMLFYSCSFLKAQSQEIQLRKNNESLLIISSADTVVLKNILVDEANGYFEEGKNRNFYIIYEYYASFNKSMVIYSLHLNCKSINVNKVIHFNYNDKEGIPYGWIYYCNNKMQFNDVNYDVLTGIKSQMRYNSFYKDQKNCRVNITSKKSPNVFESKAIKEENFIKVTIPLFFEDGSYIGNGTFKYESDSWSKLSMNLPIKYLESDFYTLADEMNVKNVRFYNDIAYYLEKGSNYVESIYILEKVIEKYPNRTVAYINLGDAYWGLEEKDNASQAYQKYIELMKASGKECKIPQRVYDQIKE